MDKSVMTVYLRPDGLRLLEPTSDAGYNFGDSD